MRKLPVLSVPLVAAAAVLAWVWLAGRDANPGRVGFRLDDAWIHMVYGRGLLQNGFLAYNDGIPSTGCTSPLWAVCLAVVHALAGRDVGSLVGAVLALGVALHLAGVAAATLLAERLTGSRVTAWTAGLLVAAAAPWTAAAYSGMEVPLAGLLLLLGVRQAAGGGWWSAGVWLGLASVARPEAGAVVVLVAALAPLPAKGARRAAAGKLLAPLAVAALLVGAHHLWASGSPLPATFHAKSAASFAALPGRLAVALRDFFPGVPPFVGGIAWIALAGLLPWRGRRAPVRNALPLLTGTAFLLANLYVVDPVDPPAFYHQRYLLPAVPLLLVALAVGAHGWSSRLRGVAARVPAGVLIALAAVGAARSVPFESRHLHNDVRNINEVQRRIGTWLGENLAPGTWIASSDAGAVRYFSRLPTLDVLGLNTPEMLAPREEFLRAHPVAAIALIPAWFRGLDAEALVPVFRAETKDYSVTSNPGMARQVVLAARPGAPDPVRARFVGFRAFEVDVAPRPAAE